MPVAPRPAGAPAPPGQKVNFNSIPPPSNYVPGLGRGATGFTTRSDIGPARFAPDMAGGDKPPEEVIDETKFDEFMGNDSGMLAGTHGEYDQDDEEADKIWTAVDDRMDSRRRDRREKRLKEEIEKYRKENPKITEQFADLKRKLGDMQYEDWEAIPEIGDYTVKNKKRMQSFVPVPDSLLAKAAAAGKADPAAAATGLETPVGGTTTDLTGVGEGRKMVVRLKLDSMADSVSGQTVVDPKGYLTDMRSMRIDSDAQVSDIKKARMLLKSVVNTNPKHAPGWIAIARLEEKAGNLAEARRQLQQGCDLCPTSEDLWLEAARLQTPENAKALLARGVAAIPNSVKLWMQAARLEADDVAKSRVLRKALERIPTSVKLWKAAVELANEDDARILLDRAVECCPQHVELWLALARLCDYDNARKVLNKARQAIPTEPTIWITAAKLEEAHGSTAMDAIVKRALRSLQQNQVVIDREWWLKQAEEAAKTKPAMVLTCQAIIKAVIDIGIEAEDRVRTWKADAEDCLRHGSVEAARAVYAHALSAFPSKKSLWRRAAQLEKNHGTRESLDLLLRKAVTYCPQAEVLWLMAAKEKWLGGDVAAARKVLEEAFVANPDSENIWLAAFKLEFENNEPQRARGILKKARQTETSSTPRVWMKSALVEREMGSVEEERKLLEEALVKYPTFDKLYLMLGQLEERLGNIPAARLAYTNGSKQCMHSVPLWRSLAQLEERQGNVGRARAVLELARLKNPKNEHLWLAAVRIESRSGNAKAAEALMAKGLQDCPTSGRLWSEHIGLAARPQRKSRSVDALKACNDDPFVVAAVAQLFWQDRKLDKARSWFTRAVTLNPDIGDFWAQFYKFEMQHGTPDQQKEVVARCVAAEPKHGERWTRVAKNPANAHQGIEEILKKVALDIDKEPPP